MSHGPRYGYYKIITLLCVLIPIPRLIIRRLVKEIIDGNKSDRQRQKEIKYIQ